MDQETTTENESPESPEPAVGAVGDDALTKATTAASAPPDSKPAGGTARKRGRPKKKVAEATKPAAVYEKPSVAVDPLFFAGLNGTLKLMVQQERQHRLSRSAIV